MSCTCEASGVPLCNIPSPSSIPDVSFCASTLSFLVNLATVFSSTYFGDSLFFLFVCFFCFPKVEVWIIKNLSSVLIYAFMAMNILLSTILATSYKY
jgi:hypothetical protein